MLRVLTLSSLFPNSAQPNFGVFVERQTLGLAALDGVELEVVAARRLPIWPLSLHPHYGKTARLPEREVWKGLVVHRPRYPGWPRLGSSGMARAMARALLPFMKELRTGFPFDVIDAEFFWPDGPAAMLLSQALGIPYSVKARGSDIDSWAKDPAIAPQIVAAGKAAHGLLAVSQALKDHMVALGIPPAKIRVHHTGVDMDRFRPVDRAAAKARLGVDGPLLAFVGHLVSRKGPQLVLAALEELPGATLIAVGDGPERGALERLARRKGLAGRVRFLGNRPHEELPGLLATADVMVLPSERGGARQCLGRGARLRDADRHRRRRRRARRRRPYGGGGRPGPPGSPRVPRTNGGIFPPPPGSPLGRKGAGEVRDRKGKELFDLSSPRFFGGFIIKKWVPFSIKGIISGKAGAQ